MRELFDAAFIPGVLAPMCVGLGNPEMRTLITFEGEASGSTVEVAAERRFSAGSLAGQDR
ncbi:MAG: hypothetical protein ACREDO_11855 [Methyloceanibacter sp.]